MITKTYVGHQQFYIEVWSMLCLQSEFYSWILCSHVKGVWTIFSQDLEQQVVKINQRTTNVLWFASSRVGVKFSLNVIAWENSTSVLWCCLKVHPHRVRVWAWVNLTYVQYPSNTAHILVWMALNKYNLPIDATSVAAVSHAFT